MRATTLLSLVPGLVSLTSCLPELPAKTGEGSVAGDCTDRADNDEDGAFDCDDDGCATSPDCSAPAGPPVGLEVTITPSEPGDDDTLTCDIAREAVDPNGDAVNYVFAWAVGDEDAGIDVNTVAAGLTRPGERWTCTVTPSDGTSTGTPASASVTIAGGNVAPNAPVVAVSPAQPGDDDALACAIVEESVDPEGDPVTYAWSWAVDGVDAGITEATVPAARTSVGEVWTCSVTPSDGQATGAAGAASVEVRAACRSMAFDGVRSYVRSTSDVELPDDVTVDVWMYWDGSTAVEWQWILAHGDDVRDMTLEVRSEDRYFAFGDAYTYAADTTPLASGRWVHVAATYATGSGASTLWIDGALADTGTDRLIPFASRPLNIGGTGAYPTARPFDGTIHSVWIRRGIQYTTAFAPALPVPTMDTELLWRLGDAAASVVTDAAGSGSDATVSNATVVEGCPEP